MTALSPASVHLPVTQLGLKRESWLISGDGVYHNGVKTRSRYGPNINSLLAGHTLGLLVTSSDNCLHLFVNGVDQGVAATNIPDTVWVAVDLYGKCDEIAIVNNSGEEERVSFVKESGDKEEKESMNLMTSSSLKTETMTQPAMISRNCEYLASCLRFKDSLGLPKVFFDLSQVTCYCETCHKLRQEDAIQVSGDPKQKYALPIGWVKLPLVQSAGSEESRVMWHLAYHGTQPGWVRKMLDEGRLLTKGEVGLERRRVPVNKEDDSDIACVHFSPTINYAGLGRFSPAKKFSDRRRKGATQSNVNLARVALQVALEPGSYKVGDSQVRNTFKVKRDTMQITRTDIRISKA